MSFAELREEALRVRAAGDKDPEATHRRLHAARPLRTWTDGGGAWNLSARGTVRDGARILAGLEPLIDQQFAAARDLLGESIMKLVITKGFDVLNVTHLGRGPNAAQRVGLLWSSPGCTVEGCARPRVEIDHRIPFRETRHTRLDECDPLCKPHHDRKTYDGWALVAVTGKRPIVSPEDPRHPKNKPKRDTS
jgi:hypothetical protein